MERYSDKKMKKKTWFSKGNYTSYIMIPVTPHSKLKKKIEDRLKAIKTKEKVKIVEKPGKKFIEVLRNHTNKQNKVICEDPNCLVSNTENGGNCKTNAVTYKITCKECKDTYIGETSRNGHSRGLEHKNDSESNNEEEKERSVLLRHMNEKHNAKK